MAFATMHFAVGMGCAGVAGTIACCILGKGWRWLPIGMTAAGAWATIPDLPRMVREDFARVPVLKLLGDRGFDNTLNASGDLFFFHRSLDAQPHAYALHGLCVMIALYTASILLLMFLEHRQRNSPANRAWRAHGRHAERRRSTSRSRRSHSRRHPSPRQTGSADQSAPLATPVSRSSSA